MIAQHSTAAAEVVRIAADLIRIDTSNTGETATSKGERVAAEYVAALLDEVGVHSTIVESEPSRASVLARIPGADPNRPGLVLHGHLDVVPAIAGDWRVDPFAGEIRDGYLWGRGAVDMKDMDAMILAVVREWQRTNRVPPRDIVLAFFADEEAGGGLGARYVVDNHPEFFEGCTEAVGEVGGYSITVRGKRLYPVQTAEKGMAWTRLTATGRAGHGSLLNDENAITRIAEAVARLGAHEFALHLTATMGEFLAAASELAGVKFQPADPTEVLAALGPAARGIGAALHTTVNPTMLTGGYKANVIPAVAEAVVDVRVLPGQEAQVLAELDRLLGPDISRGWITYQPPLEASAETEIFAAMQAAIQAEDPGATVAPYLMFGGTDAKSLARLGIHGYGFSPLRLPPELDFMSLFHGVDERVPVEALRFGVRALDRFLATC